MSIINQLKKHLNTKSDKWKRMMTPIEGVYVTRVPESKNKKAFLYLEISPLDERGKKIGKSVFIQSTKRLNYYLNILKNNDVKRILRDIEKVNEPVLEKEILPILKLSEGEDES